MNNEELLEKAFDLACEYLTTMSLCCDYCVFSTRHKCEKKIEMYPDGSFDCNNPEWWKEQLMREIRDGNSKT